MKPYDRIKKVFDQYKAGLISYDELQDKCQPIIKEMNDTNKEIAKRHGVRPHLVNFHNIFRNLY